MLREFTARSIEQAREPFEGFSEVARRAAGESPGAIPSGKSAGAEVLACTEQNVNAAFERANVLVGAKDPQEAFVRRLKSSAPRFTLSSNCGPIARLPPLPQM